MNKPILAIETSETQCGAAIYFSDEKYFSTIINLKHSHSEKLFESVEHLYSAAKIEATDLDSIAVSEGPGSFTGLRIGSCTVKSLAQVFQKPIASIPTLEVIANNVTYTEDLICALIDARRENVYYQFFEYQGVDIVSICEMRVDSIDSVIETLNKLNRKVMLLGDGVKANTEKLLNGLNVEQHIIEMNNNK